MKLVLYNAENFFIDGELSLGPLKKPEAKVIAIKQIVEELCPDILMMLEVGGLESLETFNTKFLENKYHAKLLKGNSDRGIEMGFLISKNFPFDFELISHREKEISYQYQNTTIYSTFSRDISELRIKKNDEIKLIILLVHLKSKWDREGNDPGGALKRGAEVKGLIEVYQSLKKSFPKTPIIVSGDFNGSARRDDFEPEFAPIYSETSLEDALSVLKIGPEDVNTYYQFNRDGKRQGFQLDYIFLDPELQNKLIKENSGVYRYNLKADAPFVPPQSIYERASLPSDHYPVVINLDFLK